MRNRIAPFLVCLLFCIAFAGYAVQSEVAGGGESSNSARAAEAPAECIEVTKELIDYILQGKGQITDDATAQRRWLTPALRSELTNAVKRCREEALRRPDERIDVPCNNDFILAWDPPSDYRVLGSRRYGDQAIVDVEYSWGEGTQYVGNRRIMSYVFAHEEATWRVDDVYCLREPFADPTSLSQKLRSMPPN